MRTPPRRPRELFLPDDGAATVEYAITLVAAAAFATVLMTLVRGDAVTTQLRDLIGRAISVP